MVQSNGQQRPAYRPTVDTTAALRATVNTFTQPPPRNATGGGGGATARPTVLNMDAGAIQIHATPGMNVQDVAMAVRNEMTALIKELA